MGEHTSMHEGSVSSQSDSSQRFELNVSLPYDVRFAETARELAIHAARQAGYGEEEALAFGGDVERVVQSHIANGGSGTHIPLIVRRAHGPVEVLINGRALTPHA
jgi:hypothetical protein